MIVDVRGALGGQVVSLLIEASRAARQGVVINGVRINVGGFRGTHIGVDYLSAVFPGLSVSLVDARRKVRFSSPALWPLVAKYREQWTTMLHPRQPPDRIPGRVVVHVRTGDRNPNGLDSYRRILAKLPDAVLVGNDRRGLEELADGRQVVSSPDPLDDWEFVRAAERVYGPRSYFTMSAAILDPDLRVSFIRRQDGPVRFQPQAVKVFDSATKAFPNVSFEEDA